MDKFWLKIAGFVVVVLVLVVLVKVFSTSETEPKAKPKTVYDVWEQDDERLRAEPEFKKQPEADQSQSPKTEQVVVQKPKPKPEFKELSLEDEVQAGKLFNLAVQERKLGRLPGVKLGYKNMVDHCREIIQRWPDSEYAVKARRMLRDIPQRYRKRYNITDEEIDLGNLR